jgi:hypothetical protein
MVEVLEIVISSDKCGKILMKNGAANTFYSVYLTFAMAARALFALRLLFLLIFPEKRISRE